MSIWLLLVVGLFVWAGATLLIDGWLRRPRRLGLYERLAPFQQKFVADDLQEWLRHK